MVIQKKLEAILKQYDLYKLSSSVKEKYFLRKLTINEKGGKQ